MKKILILIILGLFASVLAEAQTPCEYAKNETDPFTGEVVMATLPKQIHNRQGNRINFSFVRIDEHKNLMIYLVSDTRTCFTKDTQIIVLSGGQPLELTATPLGGDIECGEYVSGNYRYYSFLVEVDDTVRAMVPTGIRFHGTDITISIAEFGGPRTVSPGQVMNDVNCID